MTESSTHLTTSRINRLLRPLRNKCNSLAALPRTAPAPCVTYSKQSNWDADSQPLTLLRSSTENKKLILDSRSSYDFELSRRIHSVCDAFKNIAHVAYGQPCTERIPGLAAMCALVVGENMSADNCDNTFVDSGKDPTDKNRILDTAGVYEVVPPHYRGFLVVSHALSTILRICTHHHILVTILLDRCLSFGLRRESAHLLNIILAQMFIPSKSYCLLSATHPTHIDYLLDLHAKWTTGNKPSSGSLLFTTSAFCQAVLSTLSQSSSFASRIPWTSKVLDRSLHDVGSCDIDSYVVLIRTLSWSFWETSGFPRDDAHRAVLKNKISQLMSNLFDLLFTQHDLHSSPLTPSRIHATVEILHDFHATQLHRLRMSTTGSSIGSSIDLPDMIITFTTHLFAAFQNLVYDNFDLLIAILDDSSPIPTTFSKLVMYCARFHKTRPFEDFAEAFFTELKTYSSALRSEKLFRLDASLWASALHHYETFIARPQKGSSTLITRYKQQLMEAVEVAESRCFGGEVDCSPAVSLSIRSERSKSTRRRRLSGHWEWEDMISSWIQKTPEHKKRKVDDGHPHTPSRLGHSGVVVPVAASGTVFAPTPLSTRYRRSPTFSPSSSSSWLSDPESHTESGSEFQGESDKENSPVPKGSRLTKRRSSNFRSILADAQKNRIILHPRRRLEQKSLHPAIPARKYTQLLPSQRSRHAPCKQEQKAICRKMSPPPASAGTVLFSDDSLDLFAYATSSPARC